MKKLGWLILVGAVAFACGEAGQSMTGGAGATGGTAEQNIEVECDKSETRQDTDLTIVYRWAEFEVEPGVTEVTTCVRGAEPPGRPTEARERCARFKALWFRGTNTGYVDCGRSVNYDDPDREDSDIDDPLSITVHR